MPKNLFIALEWSTHTSFIEPFNISGEAETENSSIPSLSGPSTYSVIELYRIITG